MLSLMLFLDLAFDCFSFNSGFISGLLKSRSQVESVQIGLHCAEISLQSVHPVPPEISYKDLLSLNKPKIHYTHEFVLW